MSANPFQCTYVSERGGIRCQLRRNHVDSMNPDNRDHRAWDENGVPTLKMPPAFAITFQEPLPQISRLRDTGIEEKGQIDGE